jgi:hypothetical protein
MISSSFLWLVFGLSTNYRLRLRFGPLGVGHGIGGIKKKKKELPCLAMISFPFETMDQAILGGLTDAHGALKRQRPATIGNFRRCRLRAPCGRR